MAVGLRIAEADTVTSHGDSLTGGRKRVALIERNVISNNIN